MNDSNENKAEENRRANAELVDAASGVLSIVAVLYSWFIEFDVLGFAFSGIAFILFGFGRYFRYMELDRKSKDKSDED